MCEELVTGEEAPQRSSLCGTSYGRKEGRKEGREVLEGVIQRDVVIWNSIVQGYAENGECYLAFELFKRMTCGPDTVSFVAVLKACLGMDESERLGIVTAIHSEIKDRGCDSDMTVLNTLVDVYIKSGSMQQAMNVFNGMPERSMFTWKSLILGYLEKGQYCIAMDSRM